MEEGLKEQSNSKNQVTGQYISLKDFLGEMNELQGRTKWAGIQLSQEGKITCFWGKEITFFCEKVVDGFERNVVLHSLCDFQFGIT